MSVRMEVTLSGSAAGLARFRRGVGDTAGLKEVHARIARAAKDFTAAYVAADDSHATADKLGAKPTGHMAKASRRIEGEGEVYRAVLKIPRKTRLRAAFGGFQIRPLAPRKWLAKSCHRLTYGVRPALCPYPLDFKMIAGRFPALVFADTVSPADLIGTAAYWLMRETSVKEDRSLLPWEDLPEVSARVAGEYISELTKGDPMA